MICFQYLLKCLARGSPRNLRVSDATTSTMKLSWSAAPGKVQRYRITYTPAAGGEAKEVTIRGDTTTTVLRDLEQGTRYALSVTALYASGAGDALPGQGETLEGNYLYILYIIIHLFGYILGALNCTMFLKFLQK